MGWRGGKTFGREEGRDERWSRERVEQVPLHSITTEALLNKI
jgi:hypothetical protein